MYMSGGTTTIPTTRRSDVTADMPSFSNTVFEFLDENYPSWSSSENSSDDPFEGAEWGHDDQEEEEDEEGDSQVEKRAFWNEQEMLLQGVLRRTSSIESRVRTAAKEALRHLDSTTSPCCCTQARAIGGCKDCLRRGIVKFLSNVGFNCSIRKSKWKSSPQIPSGEHTYLEVLERPSDPNKAEVRVVIELNLRGEFEIARASQDYDRLVKRLPELYVSKPERLRGLIKILCGAAKKCMMEKKMHLGPWRKHKYMQAKWLGPSTEVILTNTAVVGPPLVARYSDRPVKARASMLTLSLLDKLPGPQCQAVAVI